LIASSQSEHRMKTTSDCLKCGKPLRPWGTAEGSHGPGEPHDHPGLERWVNHRCDFCGVDYRVNSKTGEVAETRGRS
jgi:hypothetical protein